MVDSYSVGRTTAIQDRDRAMRLLEKAEKSCLVAGALQFKVVLNPNVKIEEELTVPAIVD